MKKIYKIKIMPGRYPEQYRVQLLEQKQFCFLWWTFYYWEQINHARGGASLIGTLVHRWMTNYNLNESDLEDLSE